MYRLDEMLKKRTISFNCCPKYGCDGDASYCCFDCGPHTYTCGLYYVAEGNHYCDDNGEILSEYAHMLIEDLSDRAISSFYRPVAFVSLLVVGT